MPEQSFDYCALHYLNQYSGQDRRYIDMLNGGTQPRAVKRSMLRDAAKFYRVARNVPGNDKDDPERQRYELVLRVLMRTSRTDFSINTVEKIERVEERMRLATGNENRVTSFTTKMLWLKHQDNIIIFDSNARKGLGYPNLSLSEFYSEWSEQFERSRAAIYDACGRLPRLYRHVYNAHTMSRAQIERLIRDEWFHKRVFDIHLWFKGEAQ